ncbi:class I SAM-dependent methyltransferase [Paludicola sp. MB14-C6]|uniref:class I SAM-dependent methyltransferase n=1 Tax=Paludihabitans sp. MB14-C6 TaxID=3070656 RepID=UPI0027DE011F|nr:class I SAM-dependent methyltransferase [Paludicola sp. MB14-C6]WMJ22679.1 class I SAM-dependent methyltransferase [Paludicola sp. MB14-C6]
MTILKGLEWTFNTQAEKYEKMRPGYVSELYDDIFKLVNLNSNSNVIEIGIGGGQATLPILKTGCNLTAVEYGENLAKVCCEKFKDYHNFLTIVSKFEDTSFENNLYDLIFSASAFHWVPEEIGYRKVFDLLKSGGVFARFANHPYCDKGNLILSEEIDRIYAMYYYKFYNKKHETLKEYNEQYASNRADIAKKYGFIDISYKLYHRTRTFTSKEYIELLGTYSDHIAIEENIRNKFFSEIETVIDDFGGQITIYDTIDLQLARKP